MKIALLTTDTTHHTYFAWRLNEQFPLHAIFLEIRSLKAPFETFHPFEALREEYERETLLAGFNSTMDGLADTRRFESMNDASAVESLRALSPDIVIVFGTGKLREPIICAASTACLNLHGGNPEHYRGLDTHLWAIYHRDFDNLVTTLHHVDAGLDTGDIIFQSQLRLGKESRLHHLRSINTMACVDVSLLALRSLDAIGRLPSRKQTTCGRYYSFMPTVLKEDSLRKFERHVSQL